jgi:hypothetical protein
MHEACKVLDTRLPTRVVEILGPQSVRLYETRGETAQYFCLSHCWGQHDFITTTSTNLQRQIEGIPWHELPQTFQDAISFTQRLGYTYLWIDSLCILQDDIEDWRREGSKMSEIYSNAHVTLAATASSDASGGCFRRRRKPSFAKHTCPDLHATYTDWYVWNRPDHSGWSTDRLPLQQRGWAFQERLLSRRLIHFTGEEIIWECRTDLMD